MKVFKTLLLREWMQHRMGWLLLALLPPAIVLPLSMFGQIQVSGQEPVNLVAMVTMGGFTLFMAGLAWVTAGFQAPGLARRDTQDRSIEFWRALPAGDRTSVAATLCAHLVLMPLAVMAVGLVTSLALASIVVLRIFGPAGLPALDLGYLGSMVLAALPRLAAGSLLASFWAATVLLPMMAASAWLKRWGVPVLLTALWGGGNVLDKAYGQAWLLNAVVTPFQRFANALVPLRVDGDKFPGLSATPIWFWHDLLSELQALASPAGLWALAVIALSFWLLVLRRQRQSAA
jgi:hypothetical protein